MSTRRRYVAPVERCQRRLAFQRSSQRELGRSAQAGEPGGVYDAAVTVSPKSTPPDSRAVFIVHGRNEAVRRSIFDFLRSIGLQPIEWSAALAMTGTASPYIGDVLNAAFGAAAAVVVLLTPDEFAYLRDDLSYQGEPDSKPRLQARPNVLFEAGMAFGTHPDKTILVEVGEIRPFSDVAGRHVLRLNNDIAARQKFAGRLRTAGCDVDTEGTDWHTAGDFSAPPAPPANVTAAEAEAPKAKAAREDLAFNFSFPSVGRDRLVIQNRGDQDFRDVQADLPELAALSFDLGGPYPHVYAKQVKIPVVPGRRAVAVYLETESDRSFEQSAFFMKVRAIRADGEVVAGSVFVDLNSY